MSQTTPPNNQQTPPKTPTPTNSTAGANSSSASGFAGKWRQTRACARCRRLKMKCSFEDPSFQSCVRCFSAKIECSFDVDPSAEFARKKQRRKKRRTASPLGDESERIGKTVMSDGGPNATGQQLLEISETSLKLFHDIKELPKDSLNKLMNNYTLILETLKQKQTHKEVQPPSDFPNIPFLKNLIKELIYRYNYITYEETRTRYEFFLDHILPHFPIIPLSRIYKKFEYLYENYPILLVSCISVTTVNDNNLGTTPFTHNNLQLCNLLSHYLYSFIAHEVYVKCDDFSIPLLYSCLIVSSWCVPPAQMGHFRNQLNALTASNVALCMGMNDILKNYQNLDLGDDSELRQKLRSLLGVYCTCGALELSLRRFKVVSWNSETEIAFELLLREMDGAQLPTVEDRYICYLAKLISIGHDAVEFLNQFDSNNTTTNNNKKTSFSLSNINFVLKNYEVKLLQVLNQSGFVDNLVFKIHYVHLLIVIHDNLISGILNILETESKSNLSQSNHYENFLVKSDEKELFLEFIVKLITNCELLIDEFVNLNETTKNFPTVLYFRPLHALILLVRLRLVLKSQKINDLNINVELFFNIVNEVIESNLRLNSLVCSQMKVILTKIEKWLKISQKYDASMSNHTTDASTNENGNKNGGRRGADKGKRKSDVVEIINSHRDKEIENLDIPKIEDDEDEEPTQLLQQPPAPNPFP
ncbi:hypothetical protein Cantr_01680 [Candida viswanathii]|uniref:Zn(2)-C6 fungal-type domain-containing protein n=1 Tax=Candida viswanathii TaxID=5486 RepID=A0A367YJY8_9ASCO|nr:hypothetical protein Cantr_01680 [Candida viswanathii]